MRIRPVTRKNRNETMFVLEFRNQEEIDIVIMGLENIADALPKNSDDQKLLNEIKGKIISRCDDKYARDDIFKSAILFDDEFALLTETLLWCEGIVVAYNKGLLGGGKDD